MTVSREFRFAVGSQTGRRSTVWKFAVHRDEVYVLSRMFGPEAKVSLHSSGECQWSATGSWVLKTPGRRNADRHITKWTVDWPAGTSALNVFFIRIPETELRSLAVEEDLSNVEWIQAPETGETVSFECYMTPVSKSDPSLCSPLPHAMNGWWFFLVDPKSRRSLRNVRRDYVDALAVDVEEDDVEDDDEDDNE